MVCSLPVLPDFLSRDTVSTQSLSHSLHLSQVSDWTFAHNLHPVETPTALPSVAISVEALQQRSVPAPKADSKYILLVSGLHIGNPPLPTGMLRSGLC
jgi:hypothetical protein